MKLLKCFGGVLAVMIGLYSLKLPFFAIIGIMMVWGSETRPIPITDILVGPLLSVLLLLTAFAPTIILFSLAHRLLNAKPSVEK